LNTQKYCIDTSLRETLLNGRLSTVNLLVLACLDKLLFILKISFTFLTKQATLMRRSTVLRLPPQLVFPASMYTGEIHNIKAFIRYPFKKI
jgi:hypothetical protein